MTTNTNAAPDLKTVINFLMGDGPLNGFQFGETPEGAGKYWWRAELRRAALSTAAQPPADGALNTIAAMFHSAEEIEGPDGLAMMVDMSVWNAALDAFDELSGDEMEPVLQPERVPLTEEQLKQIHHIEEFGLFCDYSEFEQIARAIELAHGIKPAQGQAQPWPGEDE